MHVRCRCLHDLEEEEATRPWGQSVCAHINLLFVNTCSISASVGFRWLGLPKQDHLGLPDAPRVRGASVHVAVLHFEAAGKKAQRYNKVNRAV